MKTTVKITSNNLDEEMREQMWKIYSKYYAYTKQSFMERISSNNHYALYSVGETLIGFTGLRIDEIEVNSKKNLMMYFGQTVIDQMYRGKSVFQLTGLKLCVKYWKQILMGKAHFWCDALTYKPYLIFARSLDEYYPSRKTERPDEIKELMTKLGKKYYGESYCTETGTIKKATTLVTDSSTLHIREKDLQDADINFYAQANPNYVNGHGLLTLGPATHKNLFLLVKRCVKKAIKMPSLSRWVSTARPSKSLGFAQE